MGLTKVGGGGASFFPALRLQEASNQTMKFFVLTLSRGRTPRLPKGSLSAAFLYDQCISSKADESQAHTCKARM